MYPPDYSPSQAGEDIKRDIKEHLTAFVTNDRLGHGALELICRLVDVRIKKINTNSDPYR